MLTVFCPSRGRPDEARALLESFKRTKIGDQTRLIFLLDDDDLSAKDYPKPRIIGEPTGDPTGPLNREALRSDADIIGFIGDDSRFETPGWDVKVEWALEHPGFAWPMDGTAKHPWPSACFVSREIVEKLGWLSLPQLRRGFFDVVWFRLAEATGTGHPLYDVWIKHDNSPGNPMSPNFIPEREVPPKVIQADEVAFWEWMRGPAFIEDCRRVRLAAHVAS